MPIFEREFYRSFRGPEIDAEDDWRLVFDPSAPLLRVRHRWRGRRDVGVDEFSLEEFLMQQNAARNALVSFLFDQANADV